MKELTQERLKELLDYDPETGVFVRKITTSHNAKVGDIAGWVDPEGYTHIRVESKLYLASRLAWLYVYGYFPENDLARKNKKKEDNRIKNLCERSPQCIRRGHGKQKNNTSGVTGVFWEKKNKKWRVRIGKNNKRKNLGSYDNFNEAVLARLAAEEDYNWGDCNKESSAYKYVQEHRL